MQFSALFLITLAAALGCGLMSGLFFTFSNFAMKALARLGAASGIAAMQAINVTILNPIFLGIFLGTGVVCAALVVFAATHWSHPSSIWWLAGGILYILGNIVVTMTCNVPRNDALARLDATRPEAAEVWNTYLVEWTRWNHVRTLTALAATACLIIAAAQLALDARPSF
jgi:uncharacterized membrane protein